MTTGRINQVCALHGILQIWFRTAKAHKGNYLHRFTRLLKVRPSETINAQVLGEASGQVQVLVQAHKSRHTKAGTHPQACLSHPYGGAIKIRSRVCENVREGTIMHEMFDLCDAFVRRLIVNGRAPLARVKLRTSS